nr:beta-ketoacyl-[acyl-carrier-protein] synthase family protein [Rhodococcus sp. (in: high G+C Gram-positive bacteria)]
MNEPTSYGEKDTYSDDVAITGTGCVTAYGDGVDTLFDGWNSGHDALTDGWGQCTSFDPGRYLSRAEMRRTDRFAQMALVATQEAADQARWGQAGPYEPNRVACVIATTSSGQQTVESELAVLADKGPRGVAAVRVMLAGPDATAVLISMRFNVQGECYGMSGACAGGAMAVGAGVRMIRSGSADAVIVGGADAGMSGLVQAMYSNLGAISPDGQCRPFDRRRNGFVPGEGAGILILENARHAADRGADILGYVSGYGSSSDAHHLTMPNKAGQVRTITDCLGDSDIDAAEIDYINAHGTGTRLNDEIETAAIAESLGKVALDIPISSVKSSIGHLQGAAGAVEAIATLAVLRRGVIPATVGLTDPDPDLALHCLPMSSIPLRPGHTSAVGLTNSFGLGGHNASLLIRS